MVLGNFCENCKGEGRPQVGSKDLACLILALAYRPCFLTYHCFTRILTRGHSNRVRRNRLTSLAQPRSPATGRNKQCRILDDKKPTRHEHNAAQVDRPSQDAL